MKTLILVRHAKSSWSEPGLADRDRPLNDRGERDAPRMGERLAERGLKPDVILSSPAVRALATARLMARKLDCKRSDIRVDDRLYAAEAEVVLRVIRELGDRPRCVMLFGHNPELTELAHRLSNKVSYMKTCAVAVFTFDSNSWTGIDQKEPEEAVLLSPAKGHFKNPEDGK